jgi:hypothetical protein
MLERRAAEEMVSQLQDKGWKVFGFRADDSDMMTDYYSPAYWEGVAEKNGYVLLVDVWGTSNSGKQVTKKGFTADSSKVSKLQTLAERGATEGERNAAKHQLNKLLTKEEQQTQVIYTYPIWNNANPKRSNWHIEKDGEIVAKGVGANSDKLNGSTFEQTAENVSKLIERFEKRINENKELVAVEKKEVVKATKPVTTDIQLNQAVVDETCIVIDKPLTYGVATGFVYKLIRKSEGKKGCYYVFQKLNRKLNKVLYGTANPANRIHMHEDNFKRLFGKGCFHFANLEEVEEVTTKTVYVSKQRTQKGNLLATTEEVETAQTETKEEVKPAETPEQTPSIFETELTVTMQLNEEKNGVELYFSGKPSEEVRSRLKANGFRWARKNKCWYAKQSEETLQLAEALTGSNEEQTETTVAEVMSYPEIDINDVDTYAIDQSIQDREHDANWIFRSKKRDHNKDLQELLQSWNDAALEVINTTDSESIQYNIKKDLQRYKKNYHQLYVKYLTVKGSNPSWAVTGRGNLNMTKYNKAVNRENNVMLELAALPDDFKKIIGSYKSEIKRLKEDQFKTKAKQVSNVIDFITKSIEVDYFGKSKVRAYIHGDYYICKVWGAFRIFKGSKELYSCKTTETLQDAKQYATALILEDAS